MENNTVSSFRDAIQWAVWERFAYQKPFEELENRYIISESRICRWYHAWIRTYPSRQPTCPAEVLIPFRGAGRPTALTEEEEKEIVKAVLYFQENKTSLTKVGIQDLVQTFVLSMSPEAQTRIGFCDGRPTLGWLDGFIRRRDLQYKPVRVMEAERVEALTPAKVPRHIALLQRLMTRYCIHRAKQVFNVDESGASMSKLLGQSVRKGVGRSDSVLIQKSVRNRGASDRVTWMPVISADGKAWKPVVVFWGKRAHYRYVNGVLQTLHNFLPPCYLFQRTIPGVDGAIFFDWAKQFIAETEDVRLEENILLVLDGYAAHLQFRTLDLLRNNRVMVVALPSRTSHILQPLDVSIFTAYKSYLKCEFHRMERVVMVLDAFDIADCVNNALSESLTVANIRSGFQRTGIWVQSTICASLEPLKDVVSAVEISRTGGDSFEEMFEKYCRQSRSVVRECDVDENENIKVSTTYDTHLTAESVLSALQARSQRDCSTESAKEIRHLIDLAPRRDALMKHLSKTREKRRRKAAERTPRQRAVLAMVEMGGKECGEVQSD